MAQDHEMAFAFPWSSANEIIAGLEGTHAGGTRFPITVDMRNTVKMPQSEQDIMRHLRDEHNERS